MRIKKSLWGLVFLLTTLSLGGCNYALFAPEGYVGKQIRNYIFINVGLMLLVVIPTLIMIVWMVVKYHKSKGAEYEPEWEHSSKIEMWAWGVPIAIIAVLATITYFTSHSLDPRNPLKSDKETMTIQVVALDWKWLFIYPEQGIATVNEIAIPVDTPVEFLLTSNSTINSFNIPRLGGQLYAMAGMENRINLKADQEGVYNGISSNYSGFGFTGMRFKVHSVPEAKFNEWVAKVKASPKALDEPTFAQLEKQSRDNPVEYYGQINPLQFKTIIEKFRGVQ
ncbi:MAG: ubiquinol oxidase subunit II [Gammaproteobacteria bacterium]|nr:MAG: ubiquinol oxidase subunit II [Gammaproteobacteria bacterium]